MSLDLLYNKRAGQFKTAKYYKSKVIDNNYDGEKLEYSKKAIEFRCGVYEGKRKHEQNLTENLNVTGSSLILFSSDHRAAGIKRGDKVIFEYAQFIVNDIKTVKSARNTMYQKISNNKTYVIALN